MGAIAVGQRDEIQARQVQAGHTRGLLEFGKRLEDAVLAITRHDEQDGQLVLDRRP